MIQVFWQRHIVKNFSVHCFNIATPARQAAYYIIKGDMQRTRNCERECIRGEKTRHESRKMGRRGNFETKTQCAEKKKIQVLSLPHIHATNTSCIFRKSLRWKARRSLRGKWLPAWNYPRIIKGLVHVRRRLQSSRRRLLGRSCVAIVIIRLVLLRRHMHKHGIPIVTVFVGWGIIRGLSLGICTAESSRSGGRRRRGRISCSVGLRRSGYNTSLRQTIICFRTSRGPNTGHDSIPYRGIGTFCIKQRSRLRLVRQVRRYIATWGRRIRPAQVTGGCQFSLLLKELQLRIRLRGDMSLARLSSFPFANSIITLHDGS